MITCRTVLATAAILLAGVGMATAQTSWNLPSGYPPSNPHTENLVAFARSVETATGGKLKIVVQPNGALFRPPEIKRAVAAGQAQIGEVLLSIHENEDPVFGLDVVPFVATSYPDAMKLYKASKPAIEKKLDAQGLKLLFAVPWAPQGIYARKDLNSIADMKGLRWRTYNVGTSRIGELVGAQPVTIPAAELPQALATGTVDSFVSSAATGFDTKAWETVSHFYDVQAWIPKNFTFVNKAAFNALDRRTQEAILKAASDAEARGWKAWEEKAGWYLGELKAKGMKVQPPSAALKDGLRRIGEQLTADWTKKAGADGQAILDAYKRGEANPQIQPQAAAPPAPQIALQTQPQTRPAGRRVALVIGNAKYQSTATLANPPRDAALVATTLRNSGFQSVLVRTDLTREGMIQTLREFAPLADGADWAMVYYAGHGIEFGGAIYMIPVDAQLQADRDIDLETVNVGQVLNTIDGAKRLRLVVLDACRDNPFASQMRRTMATRSLGRGLSRIEPEAGTLVVYAAKHGETSLDGAGQNSPFVEAMVSRMTQRPSLEIRRLFDYVRDDVLASTQRKQQPFSYGSLSASEDFFF